MSLKDSLMLVLRKAMFSRQLEARKVSVGGYLMILRHFHVMGGVQSSQNSLPFSSSQVSIEVHRGSNAASNEALCLEILGNVRRCLSQQADVRLALYEGFLEVIQKNSKLCTPVLDILHTQFKKYYECTEDVVPPIKLESCISAQSEQVYLAEPLDKSADFSTGNSVGVKNNIFAILVMGVYEVLLEYNFNPKEINLEMCEQVVSLYKNYQKLADILKEKNTAPGGKKTQSSSNKTARSLLSITTVTAFLKTLFYDSTPSHQDSINVLRQNTEFVKFVVNVAMQKTQQISDRGSCDGAHGNNTNILFKCCCTMARVLMKHYSMELHTKDDTSKARGKSVTVLCLETLGIIVSVVSTRYEHRLLEFLSAIDANRDSGAGVDNEADQETIHKHVKKFQRLVMTILGEENEDHTLKEAVVLLNVIGTLSRRLSPEQQHFTQVQTWLGRLCTEQNPDDVGVTKVLLSLLLTLTSQQKSCVTLIREISEDIHTRLGDIDQDIEVEDRCHFSLISHKVAAPTVLLLVLSQVDRELDDTEWLINKMKGEAVCQDQPMQTDSSTQGLTQKEAQDKSVCTGLGMLVNAFHELVQSAVPPGGCVESLLKCLAHMYSVMTTLVKYYLSLHKQRLGHMSARFEKLVKLSGTKLTSHVYSMITYIQAAQCDLLQRQAEKTSKKDKKKNSAPVPKNQVMKETRFIPNLIFSIEQYERYLIQLSKRSKINLMENMKLSTSRDFRINSAQLQAALQEQSSSSDDETSSDDDEARDQNDTGPPSKKSKLSKEAKVNGKLKKKKVPTATLR